MKQNLAQRISEKGFFQVLKEDLLSPQTIQLICIALIVGILCFYLGVKSECERAGGWVGFQNSLGTKWTCFSRESPVDIYDNSMLAQLNISVITDGPKGHNQNNTTGELN